MSRTIRRLVAAVVLAWYVPAVAGIVGLVHTQAEHHVATHPCDGESSRRSAPVERSADAPCAICIQLHSFVSGTIDIGVAELGPADELVGQRSTATAVLCSLGRGSCSVPRAPPILS